MTRKPKPDPKRRLARFEVSFALPQGATLTDAQVYIADAVGTWRGSLRPPGAYGMEDSGDPMFELDNDTVKVKRIQAKRK